MYDLSKPQETPGADVIRYHLLAEQQFIIKHYTWYPDWEQRVADLYVLLSAMEEAR